MKKVGIIGGLGPETTAKFYLELVFGFQRRGAPERPSAIMESVPIPLQIEQDLLLKSEGIARYVPYLTDAAQALERGGAAFLVMPCNTVHIFINEVRDAVNIPVLSIVEETAMFLSDNGVSRVGILATGMSLQHRLYEEMLRRIAIEQVVPDAHAQTRIGKIINRLVQGGKEPGDEGSLLRIINNFEPKGVRTVILACTDLQLLKPHHPQMVIYDTMQILADATVEMMLGNRVPLVVPQRA